MRNFFEATTSIGLVFALGAAVVMARQADLEAMRLRQAIHDVRAWNATNDAFPDAMTAEQMNAALKAKFGRTYRFLASGSAELSSDCKRGDAMACAYAEAIKTVNE